LIALGLGGGGAVVYQTLWRYFISIPNRDLNTTTVTTLDSNTFRLGHVMDANENYNENISSGCLAFGAYVQFIPTTTQALRADNSGAGTNYKRWICQHPVTNSPYPLYVSKKNETVALVCSDHNCISGWRLLVVHQKIRF